MKTKSKVQVEDVKIEFDQNSIMNINDMPQQIHEKYAVFNSKNSNRPTPVIGWLILDTDHTNLPDKENMFKLTDEEWDKHFINPSNFGIDADNKLIVFDHPLSPLDTVHQKHWSNHAKGLQINCALYPEASGLYAIDEMLIVKLHKEVQFYNMYNEFMHEDALTFNLVGGGQVHLNPVTFKLITFAILKYHTKCKALFDTAIEAVMPAKYPENVVQV
jgi:hypothetical protein